MRPERSRTDHSYGSRVRSFSPGELMSTTQLIIVTALSLAVVALLMVRQRQLG
jgi:hypothetical protein